MLALPITRRHAARVQAARAWAANPKVGRSKQWLGAAPDPVLLAAASTTAISGPATAAPTPTPGLLPHARCVSITGSGPPVVDLPPVWASLVCKVCP